MGLLDILGDGYSEIYDSPEEVVQFMENIQADDFQKFVYGGIGTPGSDFHRPDNPTYSPDELERELRRIPGGRYKVRISESGRVSIGVSAFFIPTGKFEGETEREPDMDYIRSTLSPQNQV